MKILNAPMPGYLLKPCARLQAHDPSQIYLHALSSARHQTLSLAVVAGIGATGTAVGLNALWAELNDPMGQIQSIRSMGRTSR